MTVYQEHFQAPRRWKQKDGGRQAPGMLGKPPANSPEETMRTR